MHVLVRTVPFNVKRMRSRVNHVASSSVHNEMNRVDGHTRGRGKRKISQRGSTTDNGIQDIAIRDRVSSVESASPVPGATSP